MLFLAYSSLDSRSIETSLGMADYSYYFVMQRFLPLLREFGEAEVLEKPPTDDDIAKFQERDDCIYLSFTPPDKVADVSRCPVVPVFAWEYSTIPYEEFSRPEDNWVRILRNCGGAITHSSYAANAVRHQLGQDYDIASIAAPLWDSFEETREARRAQPPRGLAGLNLNCTTIDSASYELSNTYIKPRTSTRGTNSQPLGESWNGEPLTISFSRSGPKPTLVGFNDPEDWGAWTKSGYPWIMLDQSIVGNIELEITLKGYAQNIGGRLRLEFGTAAAELLLSENPQKHLFSMKIDNPTNFLAFVGVNERAKGMEDPRDIGLGLCEVKITRSDQESAPATAVLLDFAQDDLQLEGFHGKEAMGRWTSSSRSVIQLPDSISGHIVITLETFHMLHNDGRTVDVWVGGEHQSLTLKRKVNTYQLSFPNSCSTDYICLENLGLGQSSNEEDPRLLGLGVSKISITMKNPTQLGKKLINSITRSRAANKQDSGKDILYTSIFNPKDGRKNWEDIVTAFVYAFRDDAQATLLMKITYHELALFYEDIFTFFIELHPFACRLVFIHGYLTDKEYEQLILNSHFIVNASRGEGQCLPLMEFMSSGVPAISPANTAMLDYVDTGNAFVVESSPDLTFWPHDPRQVFRTFWRRVDWESLYQGFLASKQVITRSPRVYQRMSRAAIASLQQFSSMAVAQKRFGDFIESIQDERCR